LTLPLCSESLIVRSDFLPESPETTNDGDPKDVRPRGRWGRGGARVRRAGRMRACPCGLGAEETTSGSIAQSCRWDSPRRCHVNPAGAHRAFAGKRQWIVTAEHEARCPRGRCLRDGGRRGGVRLQSGDVDADAAILSLLQTRLRCQARNGVEPVRVTPMPESLDAQAASAPLPKLRTAALSTVSAEPAYPAPFPEGGHLCGTGARDSPRPLRGIDADHHQPPDSLRRCVLHANTVAAAAATRDGYAMVTGMMRRRGTQSEAPTPLRGERLCGVGYWSACM
jgi:hypothetical protein